MQLKFNILKKSRHVDSVLRSPIQRMNHESSISKDLHQSSSHRCLGNFHCKLWRNAWRVHNRDDLPTIVSTSWSCCRCGRGWRCCAHHWQLWELGFVYDLVNKTCVEEDTDINIINPPVTEEPTVIVDDCEAFVLVYNKIAGECETVIEPTAAVEEGEAFGFTVTPGNMHFLASWEADALVSNYTIEKWREGSSSPQETTTAGTKWTFATSFCTAHSYKLVATLTDGSTVETSLLWPFKPTNCE